MPADLLLDPQIKYWVLLPISIVMVLVGLLKSNITQLMGKSPELLPYKKAREGSFMMKIQAFKSNNAVLTNEEFASKQAYLISVLKTDHFYAEKVSEETQPQNPLADPSINDALLNMMKGNLTNIASQTLVMTWIRYFFAGFVVMKLPFPVTEGFKQMLQQGIETPNLNVRYVSSISWYFVNLLGLRPIYNLILNDSQAVDQLMQQQQNQMPNIGGPGAPKVDKVFAAEAESLHILSHTSVYDGIVDRFLKEFT